MKVTKYRAPPVGFTLNGPHTSEWISSKNFEAQWEVSLGILVLVCLPSWQALHVCCGK